MVGLDFGDQLSVRLKASGEGDALTTNVDSIPTGEENLILQAAARFRQATDRSEGFDFKLDKHIPVGAGLGGGSSDAVGALKAMNSLCGAPLDVDQLKALSAELGSDCPFFVEAIPSLIRGRGEVIQAMDPALTLKLKGQRLVLFRPDFGIHTGWAYGQMKQNAPASYESESTAEARLARYQASGDLGDLLFNSFEPIVGKKYLAIPTLLRELRLKGIPCLMSGSGSCCFAMTVGDDAKNEKKQPIIQDAWGKDVFWVETSIC